MRALKRGWGLALLSVLIPLGTLTSPQTPPYPETRQEVCLNGEWAFLPIEESFSLYSFLLSLFPRITLFPCCRLRNVPDFSPESNPLQGKIRVPSWWKAVDEFGYPPAWREVKKGWYYRPLFIPEAMQGKRIKLRFMAVNFKAEVYLNDYFVGDHWGGFTPFELDVTGQARLGKVNELAVRVTDASAALDNEGRYTAPIAESTHQSGIWQDVFLVAYPEVYVEDVFVVTSFREKKLTLQITLRNEANRPYQLQVENLVQDQGETALRLEARPVTIKARSTHSIEVSQTWPHPRYWSPQDPHLYSLLTVLKAGEEVVDAKKTRFGFREVWIEGTHFLLNGKRINLRGDNVNRIPGLYRLTPQYIQAFYEEARALHANIVRFHTLPNPPFVLDLADEMGMLIIAESALMGWTPYDLGKKKGFRRFFEEWIKRDRNHPSIFLWSAANELFWGNDYRLEDAWELLGLIKALDPTRPVKFEGDGDLRGRAEIYDLHYPHEIDVYRQFPNTCYWLEENPQEFQFGGGFDQPAWQRDKPLTVGEFTLMYRGSPDEVAFFGGEETYRDLFKGHPSYLEALGELTRMQIEGYRYAEAAQISPWTTIGIYGLQWLSIDRPLRWPDLTSPGMKPPRALGFYSLTLNPGFDPRLPRKLPNPIYHQVKKAFAPLTVFIKEYDKNFYAGDPVERTYTVYNDLLEDLNLTLDWAVHFAGRVIDAGRESFRLRAGYFKRGKIVFLAPAGVEQREEFRLSLSLYQGESPVHREIKTYSVFPKARQIAFPLEVKGLRVGVYDPRGDTVRLFDELGLAYQRMEKGIGDFDLVIIGAQASGEGLIPLAGALRKFVERGGRVVSLQQARGGPLDWLPVDLSWAGNDSSSSTLTFPLAPGHPLLETLEKDDLRFWRQDHLVSHGNFVKPSKGAFRVILEAGGAGGLQYTPLLELPWGRGRYLLSQLDLIRKFAQEPAASLILRNLLKYAATAPSNSFSGPSPNLSSRPTSPIRRGPSGVLGLGPKTGVLAASNSYLQLFLDGLGLKYDALNLEEIDRDLSAYGLFVIDGQASLTQGQKELWGRKIKRFLEKGGKVLWQELSPNSLELLRHLSGLDIHLQERQILHSQLEKAGEDSLLWGMSNHDLFWCRSEGTTKPFVETGTILNYTCRLGGGKVLIREPWATNRWQEGFAGDILRHQSQSARVIERPGAALVKVEIGAGCLIINQVALSKEEARAGRYLSTLLTNLGANFRSIRP